MTPLEKALREHIAAEGRMTLEAYMEAANQYYYSTRDPLGAAGDFTTAPEISQMFGEMIGAALAEYWQRIGGPAFRYVELGPGRGTLAGDALRVIRAAGIEPTGIHFIETSETLRLLQAETVDGAAHHDDLSDIPGDEALFIVANEFFDALPIRQMVDGFERHVILKGGGLAFDRDGQIRELSPAREEAVSDLLVLLKARGGCAIIIDYGHDQAGAVGDTLQAVRKHEHAFPLDAPGEVDLTSHVDFAALAKTTRAGGGVPSRVISQGSWLETLGIGPRAMALAAKNPDRTEAIASERRRLCAEEEMGKLFKVMAIVPEGKPMIAGLE